MIIMTMVYFNLFAINCRHMLFEKVSEPYIYFKNYRTRTSRFYLLDIERNCIMFQSIKCYNVAPDELCTSMSNASVIHFLNVINSY